MVHVSPITCLWIILLAYKLALICFAPFSIALVYATLSNSGLVCVMSEPSRLTLRWQHFSVTMRLGGIMPPAGSCKLSKRLASNQRCARLCISSCKFHVPRLSYDVLWLVLLYFKRCPRQGAYDDISPRHREYSDRWARHLIHYGVHPLVRATVGIAAAITTLVSIPQPSSWTCFQRLYSEKQAEGGYTRGGT